MDSASQHVQNSVILRVPTRKFRLSRSHHPYKRVLHIDYSPRKANVDLFGDDLNRFLKAAGLPPPDQHRHQVLHLEQENQQEGHENGNENGNVLVAQAEFEPAVRRPGWVIRFLKYMIIPLAILILASRYSMPKSSRT
ncbi:hypothetical protein VKT23_009128 [Stygiomarasmius scandens]|uniref:Uncharacterized protein n=1 Tax=Marasmiellus scandens TaxID=2682957 RepID=A0ABR1JFC2_9AGAR